MTRAAPRSRVAVLLFVAGLAISGFTILRGVEPFDEGLTLQAARRVADGQMPYRDFLWAYGPAHPYLLAGLFKAFGTSLLWWRLIRVLCDAAIALVVYALIRERAPRRVALAGWAVAIGAIAQPTGANPFAPAMLWSLGALWFVSRAAPDRRGPQSPRPGNEPAMVVAGALCALAAAWRLDFGVYAAFACAAPLALRRDWRAAVPLLGTFAVATALVYLPFVVADGPADAWRDLIGRSLSQGRYWRLPFPIGYDGSFRLWPPGSLARDLKDVLGFYVPLLLLVGMAAALVAIVRRRLHDDPLLIGLFALGLAYIAYLVSRTDEFHAQALLVAIAALLPIVAVRVPMRAAVAFGALLLALFAYAASNRLSALFGAPDLAKVNVAVADGVKAPPAQARAIEQMVTAVQRRTRPDDPIYAVTRRSDLVRINDPLIYVLTERDNPTRQDFGLQTGAKAQADIVAALERAQPKVVVRWLSAESTVREPNDRGKPSGVRTLDRWLAANYREAERYGEYEILVPAA